MMMKQSIKRMVLTGAAVTVMLSLAAPAAMAQEVRDHRDGSAEAGPIVRDHRDGSGGILCEIFSIGCEPPPWDVGDPVIPPPVVNDPPDPIVDPPPKHCEFLPKGCKPPFGDDDPVLDPGDDEDPVVTDPPDKEDPATEPPDKEDPGKDDQPDTDGGSGGNSGGGSGGTGTSSGSATTGGGSSGGSVSSASQTIDRGGTFVSSFLPYSLTTKMGDAGSAVKKNLPTPVAKSLPNTGGGWSFLVLVGAALIAGGFAIRTMVRRTTSVTRTAQ
jgi:LPXTG-motif cell wall-anchored protein